MGQLLQSKEDVASSSMAPFLLHWADGPDMERRSKLPEFIVGIDTVDRGG